jgi:hypothetical protein
MEIGDYVVPDLGPERAIDGARRLVGGPSDGAASGSDSESVTADAATDADASSRPGREFDRETVAHRLGHETVDSGAFNAKVADLRRWGVLPGRGYRPTALAGRLAADAPPTARVELFERVPLLVDLRDRLGGRPGPDPLWPVLVELTGSSPESARAHAPRVRDLYESYREARAAATAGPPVDVDASHGSNAAGTTRGTAADRGDGGSAPSAVDDDRLVRLPDEGIVVAVAGDLLRLEGAEEADFDVARTFLEAKARSGRGADGTDAVAGADGADGTDVGQGSGDEGAADAG